MNRGVIYLVIGMILTINWNIQAVCIPGYEDYEQIIPFEILGEEGVLILSNSPETVKETGVLYREKVCGRSRMVFHHVNATGKNDKKLLITVKNNSLKPQMMIVDKEGCAPPLYHYLEAGNRLLNAYYRCHTSKVYFLEPNECMMLYDSTPYEWKQQMVLSGMLDFYTTDYLEVTFSVIEKEASLESIDSLKVLDMDLAPRGTFPCLTKYQYIWLTGEKNSYYLIEDEERDWVQGKDNLTGKTAVNYGNYGILYKIKLAASKDTQVFVCPRGGIFQGTVRWENGQTHLIARKHVFKVKKERIDIGQIKKGEVKTLEYILPNGSAAPVLIGFDVNK